MKNKLREVLTLGKIANFGFLVVTTAMFIVIGFITIPGSQEIIPDFDYNLNVKTSEKYSKNTYIVGIITDSTDEARSIKIERTKNILHKRLQKLGVEEVRVSDYKAPADEESKVTLGENEKVTYVQFVIQSTIPKEDIQRVLASRGYIEIVMPNEGLEITEQSNIETFLPESYSSAKFSHSDFRKIFVFGTPALDSFGDPVLSEEGDEVTQYYAVYKPWFFKSFQWNRFLKENGGTFVGIKQEGFVSPYYVQLSGEIDYTGNQSSRQPEFAPSLTSNDNDANLYDIIFNTGIIPAKLQFISVDETEVKSVSLNFKDVALVIIATFTVLFFYIAYKERANLRKVLSFGLLSYVSIAAWISILKYFEIATDLSIAVFAVVATLPLIYTLTQKVKSKFQLEFTIIVFVGIGALILDGYALLLARHLFGLSLIVLGMNYVTDTYVNKMLEFIKK